METTARTMMVHQGPKGALTIPIEFRRALGIMDVRMLEMTLVAGELRICPLGDSRYRSIASHTEDVGAERPDE